MLNNCPPFKCFIPIIRHRITDRWSLSFILDVLDIGIDPMFIELMIQPNKNSKRHQTSTYRASSSIYTVDSTSSADFSSCICRLGWTWPSHQSRAYRNRSCDDVCISIPTSTLYLYISTIIYMLCIIILLSMSIDVFVYRLTFLSIVPRSPIYLYTVCGPLMSMVLLLL